MPHNVVLNQILWPFIQEKLTQALTLKGLRCFL